MNGGKTGNLGGAAKAPVGLTGLLGAPMGIPGGKGKGPREFSGLKFALTGTVMGFPSASVFFLGPLRVPYTSIIGKGLGVPSLFKTIAGL